jgi:ketosteroid isomerase-like protein
MSQENVEISRRATEAFNRRDRDAWIPLVDPETEFTASREWPESRTVRGREAVWDFMVSLTEVWEQDDFEIVEVIDADDDTLVIQFRRMVRGKSSGITDELVYWQVARFRDGKILSQDWFPSRAEALEAAGLSE